MPIVFLFDQLTSFCLGIIKYSLVSLTRAKINIKFLLFVIKEIEEISAVLRLVIIFIYDRTRTGWFEGLDETYPIVCCVSRLNRKADVKSLIPSTQTTCCSPEKWTNFYLKIINQFMTRSKKSWISDLVFMFCLEGRRINISFYYFFIVKYNLNLYTSLVGN